MITCFTLNLSIDRRYVVENARMGAVNRVKECAATAGGKGLNVTRSVHVLGEDVVAAGIAEPYVAVTEAVPPLPDCRSSVTVYVFA